MKNKNISFIPGCVELGDFSALSTTVAITPCDELQNLPSPALGTGASADAVLSQSLQEQVEDFAASEETPSIRRTTNRT